MAKKLFSDKRWTESLGLVKVGTVKMSEEEAAIVANKKREVLEELKSISPKNRH